MRDLFADDIETYLAERAATTLMASSVMTERYLFRRILAWIHTSGIQRWASLTPDHLDAFLHQLSLDGLAVKTRDHYYWVLTGLCQWLVERGKVIANPARRLDPIIATGQEPLPPPPLSQADIAQVFALLPRRHAVDLRNRLQVELCYSCGLRLAESVALALTDLDLNRRTIVVRAGKGDHDRMLPLMTGTMLAAREYLTVRRDLLRGPDHGALLLGSEGQRLNIKELGKVLRRVSKVLAKRVHPHLLRHSIAVHLLRSGADVRHIQHFLGHTSLDTTKIYLRLVPGQLREDYEEAMPAIAVVLSESASYPLADSLVSHDAGQKDAP